MRRKRIRMIISTCLTMVLSIGAVVSNSTVSYGMNLQSDTVTNSVEYVTEDGVDISNDTNISTADAVKIASIKNPVSNAATGDMSYSYLYFGNYPQSEVTGEELTDDIINADYAASGVVSAYKTQESVINYAISGEAVVMGKKYRRMAGEDGSYRYFMYEPIKWRVMSIEDGIAELLSEVALDSRPCFYEGRVIEDWLNSTIVGKETFMDSAFTRDEIDSITEEIDFLQRHYRVLTNSRKIKASDYTWCRGIMNGNRTSEYVEWWAEDCGTMESSYINSQGELCANYSFVDTKGDYTHYRYDWEQEGVGVCPVVYLNLSQIDYWYTETEINREEDAVSYKIKDIKNCKEGMQIQCSIPGNCKLMVACYNEQGIMSGYGVTELEKGTTNAYIDIQGTMEKGCYSVNAFFVDKESNAPLCSAYMEWIDDIGIQKQGKCGENVFYTLDYNGTLELYGQGDMYDYSYCQINGPNFGKAIVESPFAYDSGIQKVIVNDGIEKIGDFAFYSLFNLIEVFVADSVTEIGMHGFDGCVDLEQIQLSDSLQSIEREAFLDCRNLKEIMLPKTINTIGDNVFSGCTFQDFKVFIYKDSYAEDYLKSIGVKYSYINEEAENNEDEILSSTEIEKKQIKDVEFINLETGKEYLLVIVREIKDNLLDVNNVIYMNQYTADNTRMRMQYVLKEDDADYQVLMYTNSEFLPIRVALEEERGDVNGDGDVDLTDAQLTLKHALRIINLEDEQKIFADIDETGDVTLKDAQKILKKALKIE